jgi:hypothetical protein
MKRVRQTCTTQTLPFPSVFETKHLPGFALFCQSLLSRLALLVKEGCFAQTRHPIARAFRLVVWQDQHPSSIPIAPYPRPGDTGSEGGEKDVASLTIRGAMERRAVIPYGDRVLGPFEPDLEVVVVGDQVGAVANDEIGFVARHIVDALGKGRVDKDAFPARDRCGVSVCRGYHLLLTRSPEYPLSPALSRRNGCNARRATHDSSG